jgi:hypothetical protein
VAHSGTSDPNLIEATMEQTGVDEVTNMEKDAAKLWFTSLTSEIKGNKIDKRILIYSFLGRNEDFGLLRYTFLKLRII